MPRNAEKFTAWNTESCGALNANGKKHVRDLEKEPELFSFPCPVYPPRDLEKVPELFSVP